MSSRTEPMLYADSSRGVYIPQFFAQSIKRELVTGLTTDAIDTLLEGPENEYYWDEWTHVLDNVTITDGGVVYRLYQDGDLWLVPDTMEWNDETGWFELAK